MYTQDAVESFMEGQRSSKIRRTSDPPTVWLSFTLIHLQQITHSDFQASASSSKSSSAPAPRFSQPRPPNRVRILSWNIDGLDQKNLQTRTKAVCETILEWVPLFFQWCSYILFNEYGTIVQKLNFPSGKCLKSSFYKKSFPSLSKSSKNCACNTMLLGQELKVRDVQLIPLLRRYYG